MMTYARTTPAEAASARSYTDVLKGVPPFKDISEGLTTTSGPTYTPEYGVISVEGVKFVEPFPTARWIIHNFNLQCCERPSCKFYIDNYGEWYGERPYDADSNKLVYNRGLWGGASLIRLVGSCVHPFSDSLINTIKGMGCSPIINIEYTTATLQIPSSGRALTIRVDYGPDPLEIFLQPYRELARLERTIYMEKQRKPDYDPTNDTILLRLSALEKAFKAEKAKVASLEGELEKLKRTTEVEAPSSVDLLGVTETPYVEPPCLEVSDLLEFP